VTEGRRGGEMEMEMERALYGIVSDLDVKGSVE